MQYPSAEPFAIGGGRIGIPWRSGNFLMLV